MQAAVSQVCSLHSSFEKDVEDYGAAHVGFIEVWFTKLEDALKRRSASELRALLEEHSVQCNVASYQGGLVASQGEKRKEAWELFRRRLELCPSFGIETVVVAFDTPRQIDQLTIDRCCASLHEIASECGPRSIRAAVKFQAQAGFGNNLQTMSALLRQLGSPHVGLCLDTFHFYCGPSKSEDLGYLTKESLFHVHVSDLADVARELATDSDRILPGDGDIPIESVIRHLAQMGYDGQISLELMNPTLWQVPARQLGEIGITAVRKIIGAAKME